MSMQKISKNLLSILIGITLSFVLLEGLLRVFEPIEYRVKGNKIKLPRDKKYQFSNDKTDKLDRVIFSKRNHMGFRGEMPPPDFPKALTIVAIGGSTTECVLISEGKTWCDLLAAKLKTRFNPVWLGNGGLDGMSTYGHIIFMEDYIIKLKPKVALFLVGANDIGLGNYRADDLHHFKKPITGFLASGWEKFINGSDVMTYAINFYRYYKAKRMNLVHPILDFARLPHVEVPPEKARALIQEHRDKYLKPYVQRLTRLIELCRQNGIEPVFLTQPAVFGNLIDPETGADLAKAESWAVNGATLWQILELYNDAVRHTAAQQRVFVIDLARELPKTTAYFYDTYHFTNAGCQQVAAIIAQHLEPWSAEKYPQYVVQTH